MDTETPIRLIGDIDCTIPQVIAENNELIEKGISLERTVSDLNELYQIFMWNLKSLDQLVIMSNDQIFDKNGRIADYYEVNAKTQNLFSSAKTMINGIEAYLTSYGNIHKEFREYTNLIYNGNYYYQLCQFLRDYTQHGHLCVSYSEEGSFCFDLYQIIHTPYFRFRKHDKELMKKIIYNCSQKLNDYPRVSYVLTVSEYVLSIIGIYRFYLQLIEQTVRTAVSEYNLFINKNYHEISESIIKLDQSYCPYKIENENCHLAPVQLRTDAVVKQYINETDAVLKYYESRSFVKQ